MTVYVSIGNSDDRLTQAEWSDFWAEVNSLIRLHSRQLHGTWTSETRDRYQNAVWAFEPNLELEPSTRRYLSMIAQRFRQDSIAWAEVDRTAFIGPEPASKASWAGDKPATGRHPWIVQVPDGVDPSLVDHALLLRALPGGAGVLIFPAGIFDREARLMEDLAVDVRRSAPFTDPDRDGDQHP